MDESALAWLPRFLAHLSVERRLSAHTDTELSRATCSASSRTATAVTCATGAQWTASTCACSPPPSSGRLLAAHDSTTPERAAQLLQFPAAREGARSESGRRRAGAEGAQALARDDRRRPHDAPARVPHRRRSSACATRRSWSCSIPPACGLSELVGLESRRRRSRRSHRARARQRPQDPHRAGRAARARRHRTLAQGARDARGNGRAGIVRRPHAASASAPARSRSASQAGRGTGPGPPRSSAPVPPLVRDAPAGVEPGPARCAGVARAREHLDDADLHAP